MPKGKLDGLQKQGGYAPNNLQWINPQANAEDVSWLESNSDGYVELMFKLLDDIQEGERLSVKRDAHSGRWLAILFCDSGEVRNSGAALSLRGANPADALILLAYFHVVRFEGLYPAVADNNLGRWG